jgi:hypothetical protein
VRTRDVLPVAVCGAFVGLNGQSINQQGDGLVIVTVEHSSVIGGTFGASVLSICSCFHERFRFGDVCTDRERDIADFLGA